MVDVAIKIAAVKEISLKPSLDTGQGTGDCLLEGSISQFHIRPNLGQLCTYEIQVWRDFTVDILEESERAFNLYSVQNSAQSGSKLEQWKSDCRLLRQPGQFKCMAGDLMPLALASRLGRNLLVINTHATKYDRVLTVHLAATLGGMAIDNCPILLCYNGNHYNGLCPMADEDERKVINWTCEAYINSLSVCLSEGAQRIFLPDLKNLTILVKDTVDSNIPDLLQGLRLKLFSNLKKHTAGSQLGQMKNNFGRLAPEEQGKVIDEIQKHLFINILFPFAGCEEGQSKKRQNNGDSVHLRLQNKSGRNLCFPNSTVQFMGAVPEFKKFLINTVAIQPRQEAFATAQELARIYRSGAPEESTEQLLQLVSQRSGKDLASGRQEDADEFLRALLSVLNQELANTNEYQEICATFWGKIGLTTRFEDTLPVGNCSKCSKYRPILQEEEFLALMLTVPYSAIPTNLSTLMSAFFRGEPFWRSCPECCKCLIPCHETGLCRQRARCQRSIRTAPNTLCIQLTRFAGGPNALKVQTLVKAEHNLQLLGFINYELVATLDHIGRTMRNGHYISKVRDTGGSWKLYDDTSVSTISNWGVVTKNNYFLMYRKKSSSNTGETSTSFLEPKTDVMQVYRGVATLVVSLRC